MAKSTKYFDAIKSQLGSGPVTLETIEGVKVEFKAPPAQEEKQLPINNSPEIRNDVQVVPPKGAAEIKTESQQTQVNNALIKKVKVKDDFGDDIEEEIDLGNDEKLQEYLTAKHKNKHLESELELTKGEKAALEAKAKQLSEKYSKFEGMSPEQIADTIQIGRAHV